MRQGENKDELISIVVPAYNCEQYIRRCMDSISEQTYNNFEVIIVDDGSDDNTSQIIMEHCKRDRRYKYLHQDNKGVSSARNLGVIHCQGEYISFIDSDDWIEKEYVSTLYNTIKKESIPICYCGYSVYTNGRIMHTIRDDGQFEKFSFDTFIPNEYYFHGSCWAGLFRKDCFSNYSFPEHISYGEDMIAVAKALKKVNCVGFINMPLYNYDYNHDGSLSNVKKYEKRKLDKINALENVKDIFCSNENAKLIMKGRIAEASIMLLANFYRDSKMSEEDREYLIRKFRENYNNINMNGIKKKIKYTLLYLFPCLTLSILTRGGK